MSAFPSTAHASPHSPAAAASVAAIAPTPTSFYADRAAAARAVGMVLPMIEAAMRRPDIGESGFLYIVVMDPARLPADSAPEDAILYEHALGDRCLWDADYAAFARAKAQLSWRTGMDSQVVQTRFPHLLRAGETTLWGSVCLDGISIGVSGANPWYDEAFAGAIACCLRALVKDAAQAGQRPLFLG